MMRLAARDRRALLLLCILAGPVLAWWLVLSPYMNTRSERQQSVQREASLLASELTDLRDAELHRKALADARRQLEGETGSLFQAESRPLAEAGAAEYVRTVAGLSGVDLRAVDTPGGDSIASGLGTGRIMLAGEGGLLEVMTFLRRLEAGPGRVVTRGIAIQPARENGRLSFELALDAHYAWERGEDVAQPRVARANQ